MKTIPFIDLNAQYLLYADEINKAIHGVLLSSQYIMGEEVKAVEAELAAFTGSKHCITCSSGTDALLLSLMAIGIEPGDEVITSPFTFFASAEVIAFLGATPVFVDIDLSTYHINAAELEAAITPRTRAIMPVSIFGQPADMDAINSIAAKHNIPVIEDAAQSFGAEYKGRLSCNLSTVGCTSFFPSKPLGCYGDGGAVFTNDPEIAEKVRALINHGQVERYLHKQIGINGRFDTIQAAVLRVKLKYFPKEVLQRERLAERYGDALGNIYGITTPYVYPDRTSVYAQYSILTNNRETLVRKLTAAAIPTAIHYPIPLYRQEAFKQYGYNTAYFPVTERICSQVLSLPMSAFLTFEQQDYITGVINAA